MNNEENSMEESKDAKLRDKILAIDFGKSRVGLAMADKETQIAFAYGELENDPQCFSKIGEIIQKEGVYLVVVGELSFQGGNQKSFEAREVGEKIANDFKVEVRYQEEMFTTKMAEDNLKIAGKKEIKKLDNAEAARIILESFLENSLV